MPTIFKYLLLLLPFALSGCASSISLNNAKYESMTYSMFGKTNERDFYIPEVFGDSIKLKWTAEVHGSFPNTSITASENFVFVPDLSGRIFAFNIENGKELGQIKYKGAINTTPVLNHFSIIFPVVEYKQPQTTLYNYDFHAGKELYETEIDGNILSELQKFQNDVLFVTEEGKAYRYSINDEKIWENDTKVYIHSSPVLSKGLFIFGNDKGEIIALNVSTGALSYRKKIGGGFEGGFTVSNDTLFCADNSGVVYALDMNSGDIIWKFKTGYKITLTPVADNNNLYVGNLRGDIFKLSKSNGSLKWKINTGGVIDITPLVFNDYLVQPDLNKKLYFIDINNGKISKTMNFESRAKLSPVYFNGMLFLGIDNGIVMAFEKVPNQVSNSK